MRDSLLDEMRWLAEHGPCPWCNEDAPMPRERDGLVKQGLIREVSVPQYPHEIVFEVTRAGRDYLSQQLRK